MIYYIKELIILYISLFYEMKKHWKISLGIGSIIMGFMIVDFYVYGLEESILTFIKGIIVPLISMGIMWIIGLEILGLTRKNK